MTEALIVENSDRASKNLSQRRSPRPAAFRAGTIARPGDFQSVKRACPERPNGAGGPCLWPIPGDRDRNPASPAAKPRKVKDYSDGAGKPNDTEEREGLKTANVWGVLPGASDEQILIMAHTDAFFEGAMDNTSGIAMILDIARHYGAVPQARRPFDHHHGSVGIRSVRDNYDWSKVALIVNCEHPSQKGRTRAFLRHTWASLAVMNRTLLMVVAKNLGHADTRMIEKRYGHLAPSFIADAIKAGAPRYRVRDERRVVPLR